LALPHTITRRCPDHKTEIVFRDCDPEQRAKLPYALRNQSEIPWCYVYDHVVVRWVIADETGRVLAAARQQAGPKDKQPTYMTTFDVESLFGEAVRHDVIRRPAKVARPAKFCREEWTETQERVEVVA
jgi:hypothetical protein